MTAAFGEAFGHAQLADDRVLMCWIRLWRSSLARKEGNLNFALALARDGAAYVPPNSPAAARAAAIEARSLAALGRRWDVHDAISRAWRITGNLTEDQGEPGFSIDTLATATLAELSAAAYVELGQPNMAGVYVEVGLLELDYAAATGLQSMARFSGAAAAVQRGELEQTLATAHQALDISAHRPTSVLAGRAGRFVKDAVREIGPHPELAELDERIRVWGLPPTV